LLNLIKPLIENSTLTKYDADNISSSEGKFEHLFEKLHSSYEYSKLVRPYNSKLPDTVDQIETSTALNILSDEKEISAIFIDGCKSWASTYYTFKFLLPRIKLGTPIFFQDFGWYTCFWITSLVYSLREYLELKFNIDSTYVFILKKIITQEEFKEKFKTSPSDMGLNYFQDSATYLYKTSIRNNDLRGELIAQLHHIAALITLNKRDLAIDILRNIDVYRYIDFADMMNGCLLSPTYLPGGQQLFW
jgi:hypothetical protein